MKKIFILFLLSVSLSSWSQGFFNVSYVGNVVRFNDKTIFDIPIGLHVAYKQKKNIGIYTSFKISSGSDSKEKYVNFNQFEGDADKYKGVAFDFMLFNIGITDYVYDNIGVYIGLGIASITEYNYYSTTQSHIGSGNEYYTPKDRMIKELNFNFGLFYRLADIVVFNIEFDTAIAGISCGFGISLDDMFGFSFHEMYDSDEIYVPEEESVLEE